MSLNLHFNFFDLAQTSTKETEYCLRFGKDVRSYVNGDLAIDVLKRYIEICKKNKWNDSKRKVAGLVKEANGNAGLRKYMKVWLL